MGHLNAVHQFVRSAALPADLFNGYWRRTELKELLFPTRLVGIHENFTQPNSISPFLALKHSFLFLKVTEKMLVSRRVGTFKEFHGISCVGLYPNLSPTDSSPAGGSVRSQSEIQTINRQTIFFVFFLNFCCLHLILILNALAHKNYLLVVWK